MFYYYPAIISHEDGTWFAEFPDLNGAITEAADQYAVYEAAEELAAGWILESLERGEPLPEPTYDYNRTLNPDIGESYYLVKVDTSKAATQRDTTPVKKTLTIPSWVDEAARKKNINFSATLQEALIQKLGGNAAP